jgi:thiamine-phosphate pyrophosphorylase
MALEPLKGASGFVLKPPILMLVTDRELAGGEDALVNAVAAAVEGGVNAVQLREKDMRPADLLSLACRLREVTADKALFLVNGPLDIAREAGADGVHLPEDAEPPPGPWTFTWGRSVHTGESGIMSLGEAPRYLIAGPIFETRSHPGGTPAGLNLIREIAPIAAPRTPVIGIGGITAENARDVMQAGAKGVAVISAILGNDDPKAAAQSLREAFRWTIV